MTTIKITFDGRSTPPDGNWNVVNSSGQSYAVGEWVADLTDYDTGLGTGLSLYCSAAWTGNESIGVASDGQSYSDKAWDYPLRITAAAPTATFEIRGLSGGETYTLKAAGFSGNASRDSLYTIDGTAYETTNQADHTLSTIASHVGTVAGTSVEVQTTISAVNGSSYGYLSFLDFEYTAATSETATTGNVPLVIQSGYTLVDLVDPVTTNSSILFGAVGTPVTGDHSEYKVTSTLDSGVQFSVAANGVWTITEAVDGDWTTDIVVSRRVVQQDGTIGTEASITFQAPTQGGGGGGGGVPQYNVVHLVQWIKENIEGDSTNAKLKAFLAAEISAGPGVNNQLYEYLKLISSLKDHTERYRDWTSG